MKRRVTIKDHIQEIQLISRRCITALFIMLFFVIVLILRLGYLQLTNHAHYTTLSQKNWLDLTPIEPTRGLIYDRNGMLLAENIPVFSLDVIPYKINNFPKTLAEISKVVNLTDNDIAQFQKQLKQHRRFDEITLKLKLSEIEVARFSENQYKFPGVFIKARLIRHYPLSSTFSHILGYIGRINTDDLGEINAINYSATNYIGKLAIEKYYEDELHGTVGYEQTENDASGEPIRILNRTKPIPGKNLYLTIDSQLQAVAESALEKHRGAIVVIDPKTGEILALVSEPSYDPNIFVEGISNQDFQSLRESIDRPLYNRALRGQYPFASIIKPFIALQGLETGLITPDYTIFDPGWYKLPNSERIFDDWNWRKHGHGIVNVSRAIISSCDTFFYDLAHRLGIQKIDEILYRFGFGDLSGVDIGEELPGIVASPSWKRHTKGTGWYEGDTINSGIGQGYMQATPLQLAVGVATIANRGLRFTPHFLFAEQTPGHKLIMQPPVPLDPIKLDDESAWHVVIKAMQGVITSYEGTGRRFGKATDYTVAAKTGTAQVYSKKHHNRDIQELETEENLPEKLRDHSLFIAFAPVDDPKIAIAVVVENSTLAAGVARKILDYYLMKPPTIEKPLLGSTNSSSITR